MKKKHIWQARVKELLQWNKSVHFYNFSPAGSVMVYSFSSTTIPLDEPSLIALIRRWRFPLSKYAIDCGPKMTKKEPVVINQKWFFNSFDTNQNN